MLAKLLDAVFGCTHSHYSFPRTAHGNRRNAATDKPDAQPVGPLDPSSDLTIALVLLSFFPFRSPYGRFVCGRGRVGILGIRGLDRIHWIRT
jgi:hypothetical protein